MIIITPEFIATLSKNIKSLNTDRLTLFFEKLNRNTLAIDQILLHRLIQTIDDTVFTIHSVLKINHEIKTFV